jgi:hypothetical protein
MTTASLQKIWSKCMPCVIKVIWNLPV